MTARLAWRGLVLGLLAIGGPACTQDFDGLLADGSGAASASSESGGAGPGAGGQGPGAGGAQAGGGGGVTSSSSTAGGTAGSGGMLGCDPGNSDRFQDGFEDGMPTGWMSYATGSASIEETEGELRVHVADTTGVDNWAGYTSMAPLDIRGCSVLVRAVTLPTDDVQAYVGFGSGDGLDAVAIGADSVTIDLCISTAGADDCEEQTNDPSDIWWRIRADSTAISLETSVDAVTWKVRRTLSPVPEYAASGYANIGAGSQDPVMGSFDAALDDFNQPP